MSTYKLPHPKGFGLFQYISLTLFKYDPAVMAYYQEDRIDFYDPLALDIVRGLNLRASEEDIVDLVYQEVIKRFYPIQISRDGEEVIALGKEIYKIWRSFLDGTFEIEFMEQYSSFKK